MKRLLLFIFLFIFKSSLAQNYQCLQPGVKRYFTNPAGYLRGIRIDSSKTNNGIITLYPFHTPRGYYYNNQDLDTNGGSWLGKTVTILPDGTHLFDNFWGDTVVIKSQAVLNDSWVMYNDTSSIYYLATVTSVDTMTVLGALDSIKSITIGAYNAAGPLPFDSLNGQKLILSKDHGFVQATDLFMFPLHEPNKTYQRGFDYYLDETRFRFDRNNAVFHLIDFHNPTIKEIYDFEVGDRFEFKTYDPTYDEVRVNYVNQKQDLATMVKYGINRWQQMMEHNGPPKDYTIITDVEETYYDDKIIDTSFMPEEWHQKFIFLYDQVDTQFCYRSLRVLVASNLLHGQKVNTFEPQGYQSIYKQKFGKVDYAYSIGPVAGHEEYLINVKRGGIPCGGFIPLDISVEPGSWCNIYPNPASDFININLQRDGYYSSKLIDMLGQIVSQNSFTESKHSISVNDLPNGIYLLRLSSNNGKNYSSRINVLH